MQKIRFQFFIFHFTHAEPAGGSALTASVIEN